MDLQGAGKIIVLGGVFRVILGLLLVFWQRILSLGKLPGYVFWQEGQLSTLLSRNHLHCHRHCAHGDSELGSPSVHMSAEVP